MNRYILTITFILSFIMGMTKQKSAFADLPIPGIASDEYQYTVIGGNVTLDGSDSRDPDNSPYTSGYGITKWWWQYYKRTSSASWEYLGYDEVDQATINFTKNEAGIYKIRLWVKGDDGEDDWTPDSIVYSDLCYVYVSEVEEIVDNDYDGSTQYVPIGSSITLYAKSNPSYGYPSYDTDLYYFPTGSPTWSITPPPGVAYPNLSEYTTAKCIGGGNDAVTISNFSDLGTYVLHAQAGSNDDGNDITIVVFSAELSWTNGGAPDGWTTNGDIDLIINPPSVKASISNVSFSITPATTPWGNLEGSLSTISLREDSDITHWKVDKAIWYDNTQGDNCPNFIADYVISAEFTLDGINYSLDETADFDVYACYRPSVYNFYCGEAWANNLWAGTPEINTQQISANIWHATVVGQGDFRRNVQATFEIYNPVESQFYEMIGAEELYHKTQIEDADGSTTIGYYKDYWDPAYVMAEIYNVTYVGSSQTGARIKALQAFSAAKYNEEYNCEVEMASPDFYCDVEAEAKTAVGSQYILRFDCAYPQCPQP